MEVSLYLSEIDKYQKRLSARHVFTRNMFRDPARRTFLGAAVLSAAYGQSRPVPDRGPALAFDLVKEFVVAAHGDLGKTQSLLDATPSLVNATWDWGGGDFETALGGASHMGRRDMAEFLLGKGARMDLFAAAMLGKLQVVKAVISVFPKAHFVPGPHKIPLIAHARKGGPEAFQVVEFLESLSPPGSN
jgi:hypothetical protein